MGKREDILAATFDVVVDEGLPALSFSKIFERAGVGAGTVYHYFSGKETLVLELYRAVAEQMDAAVLAGYAATAPLKTRFEQLLTGMLRFALEHPRELTFLHACSHEPTIPAELRHRTTEGMGIAVGLIDEGRTAGVFDDVPALVGLALVTGAVMGLAEWVLQGKIRWTEALLHTTTEACWKSLLKSG